MPEIRPYPGCPEVTWTRPRWSTERRLKPSTAHYDPRAAERVEQFIALLRHYQGSFGGRPFILLDWQRHEVIRPLFGWKTLARARDAEGRETDELAPCAAQWEETPQGNLVVSGQCTCPRLKRTAYIEIGKKNAKTTLGAGIAGYMAFGDGEPAAEVHCYAADRDNAKLAFDALSFGMFWEGNPFERKGGFVALKREIRNERTKSFVRVQTSSATTKHGPNAHCILFDELHAQKTRELWDVTTSGIIARRQPLVVALTTAGYDRESVCWENHEYVRQIAEGVFDDPRYFGVIYSAPEDADWTDPAVWRAANPSLGVTISEDSIAQECREAQAMPTAQNAFRQLHLCQWTQQAVRYIPLEAWNACDATPINVASKKKRLCYGGLDLASTTDLAAFALVFPEERDGDTVYDVVVKYYIPAENILQREKRDRVPYRTWVAQGWITATPGNVIDYSYILKDVLTAKSEFDLREVTVDPWNAVHFIQDLERERVKTFEMRQTIGRLTAPTKELLRLVMEGRLRHGGNPVLRWNVDSASARTDAQANVMLDKSSSTARIDGLQATVMALDAALRNRIKRRQSIYMTRRDPSRTTAELEEDEE